MTDTPTFRVIDSNAPRMLFNSPRSLVFRGASGWPLGYVMVPPWHPWCKEAPDTLGSREVTYHGLAADLGHDAPDGWYAIGIDGANDPVWWTAKALRTIATAAAAGLIEADEAVAHA